MDVALLKQKRQDVSLPNTCYLLLLLQSNRAPLVTTRQQHAGNDVKSHRLFQASWLPLLHDVDEW